MLDCCWRRKTGSISGIERLLGKDGVRQGQQCAEDIQKKINELKKKQIAVEDAEGNE